MEECGNCHICGKRVVVTHDVDKYDRADYGWSIGCCAWKNNDGIHPSNKRYRFYGFLTKEAAIAAWDRFLDEEDADERA